MTLTTFSLAKTKSSLKKKKKRKTKPILSQNSLYTPKLSLMNYKVMCPSKHMKIVLLNLQDQYNGEQLYGKKREEKRRGSWKKTEIVPSATQENRDEGEPLVYHSSFTNLGDLQMKPNSVRMLKSYSFLPPEGNRFQPCHLCLLEFISIFLSYFAFS